MTILAGLLSMLANGGHTTGLPHRLPRTDPDRNDPRRGLLATGATRIDDPNVFSTRVTGMNGADPALVGLIANATEQVLGPGARLDGTSGLRPHSHGSQHSTGGALDFGVTSRDGQRLRWNDPATADLARLGVADGIRGVGFGPDYMGGQSIHMDDGRGGATAHRRPGVAVWSDDDGGASDSGPGAARMAAELSNLGQTAPASVGGQPAPVQYASGTDASMAMLREFEGFRETPYWDVNAYRTGFGSDTITRADGTIIPVTQGMTVSREDAERDLQRRVDTEFMPAARTSIGGELFDSLTPAQQGVLGSLTYNYGVNAWGGSLASVATAIRNGDMAGAENEIRALGSHNDGINRNRREREATMFAGGALPGNGGDTMFAGNSTQPGLLNATASSSNPQRPGGLLGRARQPGGLLSEEGWLNPDRRARLAMAMEGMTLNPNQGLMQSLQADIEGRATARTDAEQRQQDEQRVNATAEWLRGNGQGQLADAMLAGNIPPAQVLGMALERMQPAAAETTDDIREYNFAVNQGYAGTLQEFINEGRRAGASSVVTNVGGTSDTVWGDAPSNMVWARDENGNVITETDPQTGAQTPVSIPVAGTESARDAADATLANNEAIASAENSIGLVLSVLNDPSLDAVTGMVQGRLPGRNQEQQDLLVRIEQLQGQAFLTAFETLKGGGQITEREGQAAQAAIARLQRVQSGPAYRQALSELAEIMNRAITRAGGTAIDLGGDDPAPAATPATPPAAPGGAGRFDGMSSADLSAIDWQTLSPEEQDQWSAAVDRILGR